MGRGRAPCCAKVGLNKGSWTPEEDMRLITYIHKYGHGNWRALPKLAGLLRCGKSCRLRWINYLRPDIKRGNFSKEEEDTIIKLHGLLGNKWSKIASCLPGRTDNEIKNVWNTHIKKKLSPKNKEKQSKSNDQPSSPSSIITTTSPSSLDEEQNNNNEVEKIEIPIEQNMDIWDILEEDSATNSDSSNCSIDLPDIQIEPEVWDMINDTKTSSIDNSCEDSSEKWMEYLEKELDLFGEIKFDVGVNEDPVASYFQVLPLSSSHL